MQVNLSRPIATKQVLLADPEIEYRERLILPFEKFGYCVRQASTGPEALERAEDETLDVIVTEMSLPGFDGLELARRIRSQPTGGYPAIIACTTLPLTDPRIDDARSAGCDLILAKPTLPWIFVTRVDHLVRESRELRALSRRAQEQSRQLSVKSIQVRDRAHAVVERSRSVIARSSLLPLENRIMNEVFVGPGSTSTIEQAVRSLDIDVAHCQRGFDELVRSGFLEITRNGTYRRK